MWSARTPNSPMYIYILVSASQNYANFWKAWCLFCLFYYFFYQFIWRNKLNWKNQDFEQCIINIQEKWMALLIIFYVHLYKVILTNVVLWCTGNWCCYRETWKIGHQMSSQMKGQMERQIKSTDIYLTRLGWHFFCYQSICCSATITDILK